MSDSSPWTHYRWRTLVDAFLFSAAKILRALGDEKSADDVETLRTQNAGKMSRIQKAAYQNGMATSCNDR